MCPRSQRRPQGLDICNLFIGYINFIISDKMFYKHGKKQPQNKFDISNSLYLTYQLYCIEQKCMLKMTKKQLKNKLDISKL